MSERKLRISFLSYFFIAYVLDSLQRVSGLFVLELLQSTNVSHKNAFTPFIYSWAISNIINSFSDVLFDKRKSEYGMLLGVLLSATGAALCILSNNITSLTIFWGLIFGSGHGLVSHHISKRLQDENDTKLSFILQLTPSLGVVIMAFIVNVLNSYYGLQGAYLIFCGIILNYLPFALLAVYDIKICIPIIKWQVRKKNRNYFVSQQNERKNISIESFINCLEPDPVLKISPNDEYNDKVTTTSNVLTPIGRKRSETKVHDLQSLDIDTRFFPQNTTHSKEIFEIKNYEKEKYFEGSFNNKDIIDEEFEHTASETGKNINCGIINTIKVLEKNIRNMKTGCNNINIKNKILHELTECEINKSFDESKGVKSSLDTCVRNTIFTHTCATSTNTTLKNIDSNKEDNVHQNEDTYKEKEICSKTDQLKNLVENSPNKYQVTKTVEKENEQTSSDHIENQCSITVPLDIKIYVEECTFQSDEEYWAENVNSKYINLNSREDSDVNHPNSFILNMHKDISLSSQNFSKNFSKCSKLHKPKLPSIYSVSENSEFGNNNISSEGKIYKGNNITDKFKEMCKSLNMISSPVCLCILLIKIIYKINLVALLIIIADFGNDVDNASSDFKWILVAFGVGGLIGKICCFKILRTIPEKCNAIGVVLFLLTSLSTAGILYSPHLNWIAGFYCILGALEGGIIHITPKLILEYVDKEIHCILVSVKKFLSGAGIFCIPYAIGLFRDELGDYEFLLQILSCSSVLCALIAFFLPYLRTAPNKQNGNC